MSDPMSRHEIEDVLSSIRRLVAQEGSAPGTGRAVRSGKLILSPACRVETGADTVARLTRAPQPDDVTPAAAPETPDADPRGAASGQGAPAEVAAPFTPPAAPAASALETTLAELEAAVAAGSGGGFGDWEGEGEDGAGEAPQPRAAAPAGAGPEAAPAAAAGHAPATPPDPAVWATPDRDADEAPMLADVPTLPAPDNVHPFAVPQAVAPATQAVAPEAPAEVPAEVPAEAPTSDATPAATAPAATAPAETAADAGLLAEDDLSAVLDEAALRELVAQILREELQGVLGQRITRNVRKLVRAEIAQALASRSLD